LAADKVLSGYDLSDGLFNLEFFYDQEVDTLTLIEINPRLAAQLALFYRWVDGIDVYEMGFDMVCKDMPAKPRTTYESIGGAAASFVWRSFDETSCPRIPSAEDLAWLKDKYPEARLEVYAKQGGSLKRDLKWLQSHRWGLLNIAGKDLADTRLKYEAIAHRFGWPAPY
jgi:biotin carboxylase